MAAQPSETTPHLLLRLAPVVLLSAFFYEAGRRAMFYLTDTKFAAEYKGYDTADRVRPNLRRIASINFVALCNFMNAHLRLFLRGRKADGLILQLLDGKAARTLHSAKRHRDPIGNIDLGAWNDCA